MRLTTNLDDLRIQQPLIDKTLADEKAVANSAGVDFAGYEAFTEAFSTLRAGKETLPSNRPGRDIASHQLGESPRRRRSGDRPRRWLIGF